MGSLLSSDEKKYQPVKYDEESQQTTTKQRNPNNTCCIEQEPRKRINKESGMSLWKFMGSSWSGVDKKDPEVKDYEESLKATTKQRNPNNTCCIEQEPRKRINKESGMSLRKFMGSSWSGVDKKDPEVKDYEESLKATLSEMGAMQITEGNPNITDLSDQTQPDKIAKQFSELYDNQWRDCYMVLMDRLTKSEQETVEILLTILKTVYDISLNRSQEIMSDVRNALVAFAGKSDEESEKALDSIIQETLDETKADHTKHFKAVQGDIANDINETFIETIGQQGVTACSEYIEACVRICWLMCIKDPPMYIFCEKEDVFNKKHFMEYTEKGHKVSYVVWPVLYLYKNGPLMRKGVAQGEGKQIEVGTKDINASVAEGNSSTDRPYYGYGCPKFA